MAVPAMGTDVGGMVLTDAAARMLNEIDSFSPLHLNKIILVDIDLAMVQAWQDQVSFP